MRLSIRNLIVIGSILGLIVVFSTDQVLPASGAYQAQMRVWLAARAAGITAYLILTFIIAMGLILSHPVNRSTWKLSKRLFPWHENLFVFLLAFLAAHIVSIILDPYAGVGIAGSFIPGLSSFRSVPVALGTLALYGSVDRRPDRALHEMAAGRLVAQAPPAEHRGLGTHLGARDHIRRRHGRDRRHVREHGAADPRRRRVSLLGQQAASADIRDQPARCRRRRVWPGSVRPGGTTRRGRGHERE